MTAWRLVLGIALAWLLLLGASDWDGDPGVYYGPVDDWGVQTHD